MKRLPHRLKWPLLAVLLASVAQLQAQTQAQAQTLAESVLVVANTDDRDLKLTRLEARNLFMGEASELALNAIVLSPDNLTRVLFNTKVIGLTEAHIQAYWAQMRFSGRKRPPREFPSEAAALQYVLANEGAVGYFSQDTALPEGLVILYRSD